MGDLAQLNQRTPRIIPARTERYSSRACIRVRRVWRDGSTCKRLSLPQVQLKVACCRAASRAASRTRALIGDGRLDAELRVDAVTLREKNVNGVGGPPRELELDGVGVERHARALTLM